MATLRQTHLDRIRAYAQKHKVDYERLRRDVQANYNGYTVIYDREIEDYLQKRFHSKPMTIATHMNWRNHERINWYQRDREDREIERGE